MTCLQHRCLRLKTCWVQRSNDLNEGCLVLWVDQLKNWDSRSDPTVSIVEPSVGMASSPHVSDRWCVGLLSCLGLIWMMSVFTSVWSFLKRLAIPVDDGPLFGRDAPPRSASTMGSSKSRLGFSRFWVLILLVQVTFRIGEARKSWSRVFRYMVSGHLQSHWPYFQI